MPGPYIISLDLPCAGCGYNLRGLTLKATCPECGTRVNLAIAMIERGGRPDLNQYLERLQSSLADEAARMAGVGRDAVMFVSDALTTSARVVTAEQDQHVDEDGRRHLEARDVCARVHEYALYYFRDAAEARERLDKWGIRSSQDIGRIVFTWVDMGTLLASSKDRLRNFDDLFTLETLFAPDDLFSGRGTTRRAVEAAMPTPPVLLSRRPVFSFFCLACVAAAFVVAILWVRSYPVGDTWFKLGGRRAEVVASSRGMLMYRRSDHAGGTARDTYWFYSPHGSTIRKSYARRWWYLGFYHGRLESGYVVTTVPHAALLAVLLAPPVGWILMQRRLARRVRLGQCLECGESTPESVKERCPHCGKEIAAEVARRREAARSGPLAY